MAARFLQLKRPKQQQQKRVGRVGLDGVCFPGRSELRRRVGLDRVDAVIRGLGEGVGLDEV